MISDTARLIPGACNLITDVPGVLVGHASDTHVKSGVTVVTARDAFVASVDVMGGAPGTRETDCLAPDRLVDRVDAIVLAGGSALGLDAASGVADELRAEGRGYAIGPAKVPIVPAAIIFDLLNGGASDWQTNPYRALGIKALQAAAVDFELGSAGAGEGATTANLKGGIGSSSLILPGGTVVGALAVANPNGAAVDDATGRFFAASHEFGDEFGGRGVGEANDPAVIPQNEKLSAYAKLQAGTTNGDLAGANTTLVVVATDAPLGKTALKRLAVASQDGFARALLPSHTSLDGDLVFSLSTSGLSGARELALSDQVLLGHAASVCVSRAIARGVYEATAKYLDTLPTWASRYL